MPILFHMHACWIHITLHYLYSYDGRFIFLFLLFFLCLLHLKLLDISLPRHGFLFLFFLFSFFVGLMTSVISGAFVLFREGMRAWYIAGAKSFFMHFPCGFPAQMVGRKPHVQSGSWLHACWTLQIWTGGGWTGSLRNEDSTWIWFYFTKYKYA